MCFRVFLENPLLSIYLGVFFSPDISAVPRLETVGSRNHSVVIWRCRVGDTKTQGFLKVD